MTKMTKRLGSGVLFLTMALLIAVGMGVYVYPAYPTLVWTLLFVCWACYRLRLRAVARFGPLAAVSARRPADATFFADDETEPLAPSTPQ